MTKIALEVSGNHSSLEGGFVAFDKNAQGYVEYTGLSQQKCAECGGLCRFGWLSADTGLFYCCDCVVIEEV